MQFEWDPEKARLNVANHGVSFSLPQRVWEDPLNIVVFDRYEVANTGGMPSAWWPP